MRHNFDKYKVMPPKGFCLYMSAFAFYCSSSIVNEKVEELLEEHAKDKTDVFDELLNDPELQEESSGNEYSMLQHDYEPPEEYGEFDEDWDDSNASELGFHLREWLSNEKSEMGVDTIKGLLTPQNWDRLSQREDKPWPKNPLMEAYLTSADHSTDYFEETRNLLYEGGLHGWLDEGLDLEDLGNLGRWLAAFSYMPEWSIYNTEDQERPIYMAYVLADVLFGGERKTAYPKTAKTLLGGKYEDQALEHLVYLWDDYLKNNGHELGAPLSPLYQALMKTKEETIDSGIFQEFYSFTLEKRPGTAETINKLGDADPDKDMGNLLVEYYSSTCEPLGYINLLEEQKASVAGSHVFGILMAQWITNEVYEALTPEIQKKFEAFCKKLSLDIKEN